MREQRKTAPGGRAIWVAIECMEKCGWFGQGRLILLGQQSRALSSRLKDVLDQQLTGRENV